jgi:spore cortex formation protein SpoVR/YcgB (stage V sporulation)
MPLDKSIDEVLKHVVRLWGFEVRLETLGEDNSITDIFECKI